MIQRLALGPVLGRDPTGELETLDRITPTAVREHWRKSYSSRRMQVAAAGPIDAESLADRIEERFGGWDGAGSDGRKPFPLEFTPGREHRHKELKQQQIAITLPGLPRGDAAFPVEKVLLGVLSGGMSGRLFTEVREKQGLVYSVAAWHEQPRGAGVIHLRASSTPENCLKTFTTMMREIGRVSEDLTEDEIERARNSLAAHALTHDDVTRGRASSLSEDLYFFGRPIGLTPKIDAVRAVTREQVIAYARRFDTEHTCVATLGPKLLDAPPAAGRA
jgi:predicted Zn-dependent peptidase